MSRTRTTSAISFDDAGSFPNLSRYCCMFERSSVRRFGSSDFGGDMHLGSQLETLERNARLLAGSLRDDQIHVREVFRFLELRHELRNHLIGDRFARERDRMAGGRRGRLVDLIQPELL